ncbi:unnamed protein product [Ectocarpus sp. CCAP 1310/34]|nr:unnamed protein product [Ectocarpus sp. CCAP 1310/34]
MLRGASITFVPRTVVLCDVGCAVVVGDYLTKPLLSPS